MCIMCFIYTVDKINKNHNQLPHICKFLSWNLHTFLNLGREITPKNYPSALCPSMNRRRRLDHNPSHRKRKQGN